MDWIARIYKTHDKSKYRIKVFKHTVTVERQVPRDSLLFFDRLDYPVYLSHQWSQSELDRLLTAYENQIAKENGGTE